MITNPPTGHRLLKLNQCECDELINSEAVYERHVFAVIWADGYDSGMSDSDRRELLDRGLREPILNPYEDAS